MLRFIEDLGIIFPTPKTKTKRRMVLVECSDCEEELRISAGLYRKKHNDSCKKCTKKEALADIEKTIKKRRQ